MPFLGTRGAGTNKAFGFAGPSKPNQVTGLTATDFGTSRAYNNGRIDLSWTAPANNGATISGYFIERSTDGSSYSTLVADTASGTTTYSDTSLTSSQIYYYKVSAINTVGTGDASTAANATATTVPQAPTIGTATSGDALATVTYTAGATGGKTISTFTATSSPGSLTGTGSSPITVSGLSNGTAYTFTVTATNANGTSAASAASNSVTPIAPPGSSWTRRTGVLNMASASYNIAYGNGTYATVAGLTAGNQSATSTNGVAWTVRTFVTSGFINYPITQMTFGGGQFVVMAEANGGIHNAWTSTDGVAWTGRTLGNFSWQGVAYGNGVYVSATDASVRATRSTDGITWTQNSPLPADNWRNMAFGNGLFVTQAYNSATPSTACQTSTDGITWTSRSLPSGGWGYPLAYGNGIWVAINYTGTTYITSTDTVTWTSRTFPASWTGGRGLAFGGTTFVAVNYGTANAYTSTDGLTWTTRTLPASGNWYQLGTDGSDKFVTIAGSTVATSP